MFKCMECCVFIVVDMSKGKTEVFFKNACPRNHSTAPLQAAETPRKLSMQSRFPEISSAKTAVGDR